VGIYCARARVGRKPLWYLSRQAESASRINGRDFRTENRAFCDHRHGLPPLL
jgi:hypothetical protein